MLLILYIIINKCLSEYACGAGPFIYGPTCTSTDGIMDTYDDYIEYTINHIYSNTNLECEGVGLNDVFSCINNNNKWKMYPLGILQPDP